jgi:hypothetical protein
MHIGWPFSINKNSRVRESYCQQRGKFGKGPLQKRAGDRIPIATRRRRSSPGHQDGDTSQLQHAKEVSLLVFPAGYQTTKVVHQAKNRSTFQTAETRNSLQASKTCSPDRAQRNIKTLPLICADVPR